VADVVYVRLFEVCGDGTLEECPIPEGAISTGVGWYVLPITWADVTYLDDLVGFRNNSRFISDTLLRKLSLAQINPASYRRIMMEISSRRLSIVLVQRLISLNTVVLEQLKGREVRIEAMAERNLGALKWIWREFMYAHLDDLGTMPKLIYVQRPTS
jgi:hypothetical protein